MVSGGARAAPRRVVAVSATALEASSAAALPTRRRAQQPATPVGLPRRRARLQLTPRTPAETAARFERLVRDTAARRSSARKAAASQLQKGAEETDEEEAAPPRKPLAVGNTSEDEELLRIQKRLVFRARAQHRASASDDSEDADSSSAASDESGAEENAPPPPPPKTRSDPPARLSASFSVLEDVAALPKPTRRRKASLSTAKAAPKTRRSASPTASKALALCEWTLAWPPASDADEKLQLVLEGQVLGRAAAFRVARRVSDSQFVAATGESVRLDGCLDVEKSDARGLPEAVMELMLEGVPSHWRRKLQELLPKRRVAAKATKPPPAAAAAATPRKRTPAKRGIVRAAPGNGESEPEDEDAVRSVKRSRSGRVVTPVMDWWRGERLKTDVHGVTVVDPGSPAFIASKRARTPTKTLATTPGKPPRTPTAAKPPRPKASTAKPKRLRTQQQQPSDEPEWSEEQLQALAAAKLQIPTTAANFWAEVATFVDGKSAAECRTKSFEDFASPTSRASKKKVAAAGAAPASATKLPTKIHRAGSNLFKKQVRTFVADYEKKHVDDVFADSTPTKAEIHGALGLDDLQSPSAPLDTSVNLDDDDDDNGFVGGREVLQEITSSKRDEVDSYVLSLKRSRLLGEPARAAKPSSALLTPSTLKKKAKSTKRAVHMYEDVGSHRVEGVVSPGGTTRVRVNKDSDATSDEDEVERDSDEETSDGGF